MTAHLARKLPEPDSVVYPANDTERFLGGSSVAHYEGRNYPTVCPYVFYRDGGAALDYLTRVFGFTERMRTTAAEGGVGHAEVQLGESVVMIACPPEFVTPKELGEVTVGLYVHVDDVDAHYRRAVEAGAQPDEEPTDQPYGVRSYGVKDPEGHQWWFSQPLTVA